MPMARTLPGPTVGEIHCVVKLSKNFNQEYNNQFFAL